MNTSPDTITKLSYLDSLAKTQRPNNWESPEEVARGVLETEANENQITNSDTTKANFNPMELRSYRAVAGLQNLCNWAEQEFKWDLTKVKTFLAHENIVTSVPSRAKSGWAISLAKTTTNVNVNEIKEHALAIQEKFDQKKGILDGIKSKIPFMGK